MNPGMYSSKTDDWATPQYVYDMLDEEFHFTLDPCASPSNAKCGLFFTREQDGLLQSWADHRVFMNPPYGRVIGSWVRKARQEADRGALVVCLLPSRTDTAWFHDHIDGRAEIRFIRGRLKFGAGKNNAPFPSMVCVFLPPAAGADRPASDPPVPQQSAPETP